MCRSQEGKTRFGHPGGALSAAGTRMCSSWYVHVLPIRKAIRPPSRLLFEQPAVMVRYALACTVGFTAIGWSVEFGCATDLLTDIFGRIQHTCGATPWLVCVSSGGGLAQLREKRPRLQATLCVEGSCLSDATARRSVRGGSISRMRQPDAQCVAEALSDATARRSVRGGSIIRRHRLVPGYVCRIRGRP